MNLGELIAALEKEDPERVLPLGFGRPHSYRGNYHHLAFEPRRDVTIRECLATARGSVGDEFSGWKGGDFRMDLDTPCHLAEQGSSSPDSDLSPALLYAMLHDPHASPLAFARRILEDREERQREAAARALVLQAQRAAHDAAAAEAPLLRTAVAKMREERSIVRQLLVEATQERALSDSWRRRATELLTAWENET